LLSFFFVSLAFFARVIPGGARSHNRKPLETVVTGCFVGFDKQLPYRLVGFPVASQQCWTWRGTLSSDIDQGLSKTLFLIHQMSPERRDAKPFTLVAKEQYTTKVTCFSC